MQCVFKAQGFWTLTHVVFIYKLPGPKFRNETYTWKTNCFAEFCAVFRRVSLNVTNMACRSVFEVNGE